MGEGLRSKVNRKDYDDRFSICTDDVVPSPGEPFQNQYPFRLFPTPAIYASGSHPFPLETPDTRLILQGSLSLAEFLDRARPSLAFCASAGQIYRPVRLHGRMSAPAVRIRIHRIRSREHSLSISGILQA
jgi:hypothetical protein